MVNKLCTPESRFGRPARGGAILFVCTANICRSPMAEAVMKRLLHRHGGRFSVESAATHDYFVGMPPDPTAVTVARQRGYDLTGIRARRICAEDFSRFDLIIAMDYSNFKTLRAASRPNRSKVRLLLDFAGDERAEVPDPYNHDRSRYALALQLIEVGCQALGQHLRKFGETRQARPWFPQRLVTTIHKLADL